MNETGRGSTALRDGHFIFIDEVTSNHVRYLDPAKKSFGGYFQEPLSNWQGQFPTILPK